MKITVLSRTKNKITFKLEGATHTFANSLKEALLSDSEVVGAGYHVDHPITNIPTFIVESKGEDVVKALNKAVTKLQRDFKTLEKEFSKSLS